MSGEQFSIIKQVKTLLVGMFPLLIRICTNVRNPWCGYAIRTL
jgi:hypothetical protein